MVQPRSLRANTRRRENHTRYAEQARRVDSRACVSDAGTPRELVEAAREAIKGNKAPSSASDRFWELSGGSFHCDECGCRMATNTTLAPVAKGRGYYYYRCPKKRHYGREACSHSKHHRAEKVESAVWSVVSGILMDP